MYKVDIILDSILILLIIILIITFICKIIIVEKNIREINNNISDIKSKAREESLKSKSKLERNVIDIKDNKETVNLNIKIKGK